MRNGLIVGTVSAVPGGMFSTGGPPMAVYNLAISGDDKEQHLANMQSFFVATSICNTAMHAAHGYITKEVLLLSVVGIIASFGGIWIGSRIFDRINAAQQRKMIYALMMESGSAENARSASPARSAPTDFSSKEAVFRHSFFLINTGRVRSRTASIYFLFARFI